MYTAREIKLGSVVKHLTVDPGIASSTFSHQLKLLKRDLFHEDAPGFFKKLVCHVWWAL